MEYFELFELPVQLEVDPKALRGRYLELSRRYHPDYFANANASEQAHALDASAQLNKAFKVFSNRADTIRYVLEQKGLLEAEEQYKLSNDFLMEMMEFNEQLAEIAFDADPAQKAQLQQQLKQLEDELYAPVAPIVANYQEGVTSEEKLLQVKDYYFRKKYLERLQQQLSGLS